MTIEQRLGYERVVYESTSGEHREVLFQLLKRKQAFKVYNGTLKIVIDAMTTAGVAMQSGNATQAVSIIGKLDDDVIWDLAQKLLRGCSLHKGPEPTDLIEALDDLEKTDYFEDNWNELYLLIYHGVQANFPKCISQLKTKLGGFGAKMEAAADTLTK